MNTYEDIFDRALRENPVSLSSEGMARRRTMGQALKGAVISRRRRRRAAQAGAVLALAATVLWIWLPMTSPRSHELLPSSSSYEHLVLVIVQDQPGIMERFAFEPTVVPAETWIDDAELIELLRAAGKPSGVLRTEGRFMLTNPMVAEEPPG